MGKNCFYPILSLVFILSNHKEKEFFISGNVTGIADSTQVILINLSSGEEIDSSYVIKNKFFFKGKLNDVCEELRIISGKKELAQDNLFYTDLVMGNEKVVINGDVADMPLNVSTSGSAFLKQAEIYHKQLYAWNKKVKNLRTNLKSFPDSVRSVEKDQTATKLKLVQDSLENWQTSFITENFNSFIALVLYNYRRDFPADTLKKLYNNLSKELKQSKFGQSIYIQINNPKPQTGDKYYDFEATTVNGNRFKLSELNGKYILLQFAGAACYWSHKSMPELSKLSRQYKDSVYFVSYFMDNKTDWLSASTRDTIIWSGVWSKGFKYSDACSKYSVTGTPTFFLISPGKKIISTWFGYEKGMVEKEIKIALGKVK